MRRPQLLIGSLVGLALAGPGCKVTPEKIAAWKETEKGPGKLREALRDGALKPELRGQALAVLSELSMLGEVEADLKLIPAADQPLIARAAAPLLMKLARGAVGTETTTRVQRNAKDALFLVRGLAAAADRPPLDDALIEWTTADLAGRMAAGGQGSDKILTAIGQRAGPRLAAIVADPGAVDASRTEAARLCATLCDRASREQAGGALVERARKERGQQESTLAAIGIVGGDHAVAFLAQLAEDGKQTVQLRQKALLALVQTGDPASLPAALRIAGDKKAAGEIRDAAFELAEKIGETAVPGLLKFFSDADEKVRWRAVEAALGAGKEKAVIAVLTALPEGGTYSKEDLRSFVVHDLRAIGPGAVEPLRAALATKGVVARLAAVLALAEIGHAADAPAVAALSGDTTKLKGWPAGATLGAEAKAAAAALAGKR